MSARGRFEKVHEKKGDADLHGNARTKKNFRTLMRKIDSEEIRRSDLKPTKKLFRRARANAEK